jgi:hypothetical protein
MRYPAGKPTSGEHGLNRLVDDSSERQIHWLPGERIELALDSRAGTVASPVMGRDILTITTRRAIRLAEVGGMRTTEIVRLDSVLHIEIKDVSRDLGRLVNGLVALAIGIVFGWVAQALLAVTLISLLVGGIPILGAIFMISRYLLPDEEGALILYTAGSILRHPLLSVESRRDAYLLAHRVYELMEWPSTGTGGIPVARVEEPDIKTHLGTNRTSSSEATLGVSELSGSPAASELESVLRLAFEPTNNSLPMKDLDKHIERGISATTSATSYITRQLILDPKRHEMGEGDYIWDLEFAAPDGYRVSQTGWSSTGVVRERWLTIGNDFYFDSQGWHRTAEPLRFEEELALNKNLSVKKYVTILKQGIPTSYDVVAAEGHDFLHLTYQPVTRESLSAVLGNPSPMQGIGAAADLWINLDTHLLTKAEVFVFDARNGQRTLFQQSFASYNSDLGVVRPGVPRNTGAR